MFFIEFNEENFVSNEGKPYSTKTGPFVEHDFSSLSVTFSTNSTKIKPYSTKVGPSLNIVFSSLKMFFPPCLGFRIKVQGLGFRA